jgi:hypothetical protein
VNSDLATALFIVLKQREVTSIFVLCRRSRASDSIGHREVSVTCSDQDDRMQFYTSRSVPANNRETIQEISKQKSGCVTLFKLCSFYTIKQPHFEAYLCRRNENYLKCAIFWDAMQYYVSLPTFRRNILFQSYRTRMEELLEQAECGELARHDLASRAGRWHPL